MRRLGKRFVSMLIIIAMLTAMLPAQALAAEKKSETSDEIFSESAPIEALNVASQPDFSFTTIGGKVIDAQGNGLAGVSVLLYNTDENTTLSLCITDATGSWVSADYDVISGYTYIVRYYKSGYTITPNNIRVTALSGGTTVETATVTPLDIGDLVCNEADYTYTVDTERATITEYTGTDTAILLPAELGGYPVAAIGARAFEDNTALQTVCFSENITRIERSAFEGCTSLNQIFFSNTLSEIGSYAFYSCASLTELSLPNSLTSIGSYAFFNCAGFTSIELPDSVTSIGGYQYILHRK